MNRLLRCALATVICFALLVGLGLPSGAASARAATHLPSLVDQRNFRTDVRPTLGGTPLQAETATLRPHALPALVVLGALGRLGINWVLKWYGKTQLKKAAKSYLLNNIRPDRWAHIMAPKHKWDTVGARSKEQVAELMSRAMAEGRHAPRGSDAMIATWNHQGKVIEVTYARSSGQISNGWVK